MKNKKKRIIGLIILVLIILTAGIFIFGYNRINSQKNEKKSLETKSDINKNTKKEKVETIKEEEEQQEESKEEELEENKKTTKTVEENKSIQKTTTSNSNNNSNSNSNKNYSAPANTQNNNNNNNQQQEAPKPVVDNRTAWEKLGISEYDYYHTEMYGARVDLYNTDISFCNSEARRILNSYEDVANTRSYSGTGKYTYSYIGCSVDVTFYDGRIVGYNEAKRILGF